MKYENGKDILPEALLTEIQKYASGKLIYIPQNGNKREWGESSGYKQYLAERNRDIRAKFRSGTGIEELADAYFLSPESIKKIVYAKKEAFIMEHKSTLSSAKAFARHGKLEEWVHSYLLSDGHNREFSEGLKLYERYFIGPVKLPLSLFTRCCGPEAHMKWRVNAEWFEKHVCELQDIIQKETDLPPLIVHYFIPEGTNDGEFELNDGNHRYEAYSRLGIKEYDVIVWITEKTEYDLFLSKYAAYFK